MIVTGGGGLGTDFDCDGGLIAPDVARCDATREGSSQDYETTTMIARSLRADGFDASEDGTGRGTPLVAFDTMQITSKANRSHPKPGDPCHPIAAGAHPPAVAFNWQNGGGYGDAHDGLGISEDHTPPVSRSQVAAVASSMTVRRLTPRECERLQGFPDDFTLVPYRGKPAADGPRYKALGNSMAVPVVRWIGRRIQVVDSL